MSSSRKRDFAWIRHLLLFGVLLCSLTRGAVGQDENNKVEPLSVGITYPPDKSGFVIGMSILVQAEVQGGDSPVDGVSFFANGELIGEASAPPYAIWWAFVVDGRERELALRAVVTTGNGETASSAITRIAPLGGPPPFYSYQITSPRNGEMVLVRSNFTFTAQRVAGPVDQPVPPVNLYVGNTVVGSFTAPPYSVVVSNLPAGSYTLRVRKVAYETLYTLPVGIRVADLGFRTPLITGQGRFAVEVLTAHTKESNIVEESIDLLQWRALATNRPAVSTFTYSAPRSAERAFYRVRVPP